MWTDLGWFSYQLEVHINLNSDPWLYDLQPSCS